MTLILQLKARDRGNSTNMSKIQSQTCIKKKKKITKKRREKNITVLNYI